MFLSNLTFAQLYSTSIITEEVLDHVLIEPEVETDSEELVEILENLIRNPIDINLVDAFDLSKLPNMDPQSAQRIIEHRNNFGYFFSPNELFAIRELDKQLIESILPFIKTSKPKDEFENYETTTPSSKSFFNKSKVNIRSRVSNDLQNRDGFTSGKYQGSKLKSYNRFLYNFDKNYQAGVLVEKDAGELSYADFTSFHLQVKEIGYVKLMVYDIKGELVSILVNKKQNAGYYEVEFNIGNGLPSVPNVQGLASGIYLYRIEVISE